MSLTIPLRGVVPPLVTPLARADRLDADGLSRLIEHVLAGGVAGLFVLGTTGEGPSLSYRLRREMIQRSVQQVNGRVPVLVGITDTAFAESVRLAEHAAEVGAAALVLAPPPYFPAEQEDLARYVEHLVREVSLPLYLYNMPTHTKLSFAPETVRRLMQVPQIAGIKDSSGQMIYFHKLCRLAVQRPDWSVLIGPEELLAESVLLGGDGGVSGGANLFPRLYVELYEAARAGDRDRAATLHTQVMRLASAVYSLATHGAAVTAGLKSALACLGICQAGMAQPFTALADAECQILRQRLAEITPELPSAATSVPPRRPDSVKRV